LSALETIFTDRPTAYFEFERNVTASHASVIRHLQTSNQLSCVHPVWPICVTGPERDVPETLNVTEIFRDAASFPVEHINHINKSIPL